MPDKITELYGVSCNTETAWSTIIRTQQCPFLGRKCLKNRKSDSTQTIGTCTVVHKKVDVIICPHRLLERRQIFFDCLHLLTIHEPGNELHVVSEISIPGGNVDYFLVSAYKRKIRDFVGIELQTLDSTGSIWPARQAFASKNGVKIPPSELDNKKAFGMNWKMTAKTILVQLHHKIQTFQYLNKHLAIVIQDHFLDYMQQAFDFAHIKEARLGDPMHFHIYSLERQENLYSLILKERISTDTEGIAKCLGLQANPNVELKALFQLIESKLSNETLLKIAAPFPIIEGE